MRLEIGRGTAKARIMGRKVDEASVDDTESYMVIVAFDSSSKTISAWHAVPVDDGRHRSGSLEGKPVNGLESLSTRELEVLHHLALGEADKTIARILMISIGTVKVHVKTIIRKLGVDNRTQAAIMVLGNKFFSDDHAANEDRQR